MLDKKLLARHPLLSKLSGEVIWMLFEEEGVDAKTIDSFFDYFGRLLRETVALMGRLLDPDDTGASYFRIRQCPEIVAFAGAAPFCSSCATLSGLVIPVSQPDFTRWLPPYSLGCRLRAECLSAEEAAGARMVAPDAMPPAINLVCDSGWIFHGDWSAGII